MKTRFPPFSLFLLEWSFKKEGGGERENIYKVAIPPSKIYYLARALFFPFAALLPARDDMTTALVGAAVAAPATLDVVDAVERCGGGGGNHLCGQHSSRSGALAFSLSPLSKS